LAARSYCWTGIGEILGSISPDAQKRKASCDGATQTEADRKACYQGAAV
jgi:hypothetical protein